MPTPTTLQFAARDSAPRPHGATARFADAVDAAFADLERSVRQLAGDLSPNPVKLMEAAFMPLTGPLTDLRAGLGAQLAMQRLFITGFARYRLRAESAGTVNDRLAAAQGMTLAGLLSSELGRIAQRLGMQPPASS